MPGGEHRIAPRMIAALTSLVHDGQSAPGQELKGSINRPDTEAQDQLLQIIIFDLQRAAGPDGPNSDISQLLFDHLVRAVLSNAVEIKGERPGSGQQKPIARKRQKSDIKTKGAGRSGLAPGGMS